VDAADYATWRNSVGSATIPNRDPGNTGPVGQPDYDTWRARFGQSVLGSATGATGSASAIPEPTACSLACWALMSVARGARVRQRNPRQSGGVPVAM